MKYKIHNKGVLRTPSHSFKKSFTKDELIEFFNKEENKESLFIASPGLLNRFNEWQSGKIITVKDEERILLSLLKYALRTHTRCTPFGLFSGSNVIDINSSLNIKLNPELNYRNTRLDMDYTSSLVNDLSKIPEIRNLLDFFPNNTIFELKDKIRFVEYSYLDGRRFYKVSSIDNSKYIQIVLKYAEKGSNIKNFIKCLMDLDNEIDYLSAENFILELISSQVIVSEIDATVSGEELLESTYKRLTEIKKENSNNTLVLVIKNLSLIKKGIYSLDKNINNDIVSYSEITEIIKQNKTKVEVDKLFQTDLYISPTQNKPTKENQFNKELKSSLINALKVLNKLTPKNNDSTLKDFTSKFYNRYEEREVPLLEVLDPESGLGYGKNGTYNGSIEPLIKNIKIHNYSSEANFKMNKESSFLFNKLLKATEEKQFSISLEEKDLKGLDEDWDDLPSSFSLMFEHLGFNENEKESIYIKSTGGSSAVNFLGRFALGNSKINDLIHDIIDEETQLNSESILAEIVHLPQNRTGNVLLRPSFRKYEIPYLSQSKLPFENQINLKDIFISLKNNEIVLRSKKLNKRIIPYLGNAHNFAFNSLPIYHFLCDLQTQNKRVGLYFNWGIISSGFLFLPRVKVGSVIISPATWQLNKNDFEKITKNDIENSINVLDDWRSLYKIPEVVILSEGDNNLTIDFNNKLSVKMFISVIKNKNRIILNELLYNENKSMISDQQNQPYTNEFIFTLIKKNTSEINKPINFKIENIKESDRSFSLGSEWIYYKIYCGIKTADTILCELIYPLIKKMKNEKLIDLWFFIRYSDPDPHIRFRMHISDINRINIIINSFNDSISKYKSNTIIWKVQLGTYIRELERYNGIEGTIISENIFHFDSECIILLLKEIAKKPESEEKRWKIGLLSIDKILNDFNFSLVEKRDLMLTLKTGFGKEFGMNKYLNKQIDKEFRIHRLFLEDLLNGVNSKELEPLILILEAKSNKVKHEVKKLNLSKSQLNELLPSHIHMTLNRTFKSKQRMQEMVIYNFLWRIYHSKLARK